MYVGIHREPASLVNNLRMLRRRHQGIVGNNWKKKQTNVPQ